MPANDDLFEKGKNIHAIASYYLKKDNIDKMESSLSSNELELWKRLKSKKYFSYDFVGAEYNLTFKLNDAFYGGRLDALVRNEDKYYILDYKTGSAPKNARYEYQTMIYLLAVRSFFKTDNVAFVYIDLKNNDEVVIELTSELVIEYEQKLTNILIEISREDYSRKKADCICEYNKICH